LFSRVEHTQEQGKKYKANQKNIYKQEKVNLHDKYRNEWVSNWFVGVKKFSKICNQGRFSFLEKIEIKLIFVGHLMLRKDRKKKKRRRGKRQKQGTQRIKKNNNKK
jgi:hypothetical protein